MQRRGCVEESRLKLLGLCFRHVAGRSLWSERFSVLCQVLSLAADSGGGDGGGDVGGREQRGQVPAAVAGVCVCVCFVWCTNVDACMHGSMDDTNTQGLHTRMQHAQVLRARACMCMCAHVRMCAHVCTCACVHMCVL